MTARNATSGLWASVARCGLLPGLGIRHPLPKRRDRRLDAALGGRKVAGRSVEHSGTGSLVLDRCPRGSPHRRELYGERTCSVVLVEIDPLVDRVRLVLSCAEGHGRNTVADHPVLVEPAIRGTDARGFRRFRTPPRPLA